MACSTDHSVCLCRSAFWGDDAPSSGPLPLHPSVVSLSTKKKPYQYFFSSLTAHPHIASLAILVALCTLERAIDPFILPGITPLITVLTRTSTVAVNDKLDDSISRRASAELRRPRPIVPLGPRPLEPTRRAVRISSDHTIPVNRPSVEADSLQRPDPGVLRPSSWSTQHQAAHHHQPQEPALHFNHHQAPPPVYRGPPMAPLTRSITDQGQNWTALTGDPATRRGGGSLAPSVTSGTLPHPLSQPHPPMPQRSPAPYGVWGPTHKSMPSLPAPPPPPPPPPPSAAPQPARTNDAGNVVGRRSMYGDTLSVPIAPAINVGGVRDRGEGAPRRTTLHTVPQADDSRVPVRRGASVSRSASYRIPARVSPVASHERRGWEVEAGLVRDPPVRDPPIPLEPRKASSSRLSVHEGVAREARKAVPTHVRIPGAYVEDCNDE